METISILGCGWLGLPLASFLISTGHQVKGSTRTESELDVLRAEGISPYLVDLDPEVRGSYVDEFFDSEILIVNFPPARRDDIVEYHQKQITSLITRLDNVDKVLFVSSTSVYPDTNGPVVESDDLLPTKSSGRALLRAEKLLMNDPGFAATVIRFGGLIGYNRMPGRFLAGKKEVANGEAPVNLIHRDDCIRIVHSIVSKDVWGETFNACADIHPTRKEFYVSEAKNAGLVPPKFLNEPSCSYKVVNSGKMKRTLDYEFIYPDPSTIIEDS